MKFEEWAKKYNLGSMQPEGDGWSWEFVSSNSARAAWESILDTVLEEIQGELYGHDTGEMGNRILEAIESLKTT